LGTCPYPPHRGLYRTTGLKQNKTGSHGEPLSKVVLLRAGALRTSDIVELLTSSPFSSGERKWLLQMLRSRRSLHIVHMHLKRAVCNPLFPVIVLG